MTWGLPEERRVSELPFRKRRAQKAKALGAPTPTRKHHVVLVGLMGSGKTTVGKLLAERLKCDFVDLDDVVARHAGQSITDIFRHEGEVGFRARERAALREILNRPKPMVLATGGGTFADASMRGWIQKEAQSIYLQAHFETLLNRVGSGAERKQRPLLRGPDPSATLQHLLQERAPAYELSDHTIATDDLRPEEIVEDAARILHGFADKHSTALAPPNVGVTKPEPQNIEVLGYPVVVRSEAPGWVAEHILQLCRGPRVGVFTDTHVQKLHAEPLAMRLREAGKEVQVFVVKAGEESKTLAVAEHLYDQLLAQQFDRSDVLIACGGGVIGDLTGFVASTYLRGLAFVQVPTTTLAAVDAAIGGKTGLNTARGKNLIGTFYQPKAVLVATPHLTTQSRRQHVAGLVEAFKVAATLDAKLFEDLEKSIDDLLTYQPTVLADVLQRAMVLKGRVVEKDEKEHGIRVVLNYGHTMGHAIEAAHDFKMLHGEAVALGMLAEAEWAESVGLSRNLSQRFREVFEKLGVPVNWQNTPFSMQALGVDKKRSGAFVALPVVPKLGTFQLQKVRTEELQDFLKRKIS